MISDATIHTFAVECSTGHSGRNCHKLEQLELKNFKITKQKKPENMCEKNAMLEQNYFLTRQNVKYATIVVL